MLNEMFSMKTKSTYDNIKTNNFNKIKHIMKYN